ncbi:hypothetical protein CH63R_00300 [Colletotrichum higginsianum IMI 349063]|uniref:Uncharacterized protein n=1 Tax=Colletotrichum higginsianum (strain IMI 349063) TaxID=759273 RepID=A0A1B7YSU6_COLHI|nr:hypothetical protein CH63R_00300 [Colletotrichum higginsianum IMI 349063]OBR15120.1 hypothetical protein CH63R_00300 [Colletotrichum higginsianum IMI 349063]
MPHERVPREPEASSPLDPGEVRRRRRLGMFSRRLAVHRVDIWTAGNTESSSSSTSSPLPMNNQADLNPAQSTKHFPERRRDPAAHQARNPTARNSQTVTSSSEPSRQSSSHEYGDGLPCTVHPLDSTPFQRSRSLRQCNQRLSRVRGNSVLLDTTEANVVNSALEYVERPLPPLPRSSPHPSTEDDEENWRSTKEEQEVLEEVARLL